jgi:hypothetical protein
MEPTRAPKAGPALSGPPLPALLVPGLLLPGRLLACSLAPGDVARRPGVTSA